VLSQYMSICICVCVYMYTPQYVSKYLQTYVLDETDIRETKYAHLDIRQTKYAHLGVVTIHEYVYMCVYICMHLHAYAYVHKYRKKTWWKKKRPLKYGVTLVVREIEIDVGQVVAKCIHKTRWMYAKIRYVRIV